MSQDENPSHDEVLSYRSGSDDAPARLAFSIMLVGGFVTSSVFVVAVGCAWILCNINLNPPTTRPSPLIWKEPLFASAVVLMLLTGIGVWAHLTGKRAILLGLLIGFGLSTLVEGICFAGSR
jgi:hypothetical protein